MNVREGSTVVVTGGGRGFGKAFGEALAAEGAHAVLIDLDSSAVCLSSEHLAQLAA
jgi:3-oxoacyl-[acyl-carrier protein] reductase